MITVKLVQVNSLKDYRFVDPQDPALPCLGPERVGRLFMLYGPESVKKEEDSLFYLMISPINGAIRVAEELGKIGGDIKQLYKSWGCGAIFWETWEDSVTIRVCTGMGANLTGLPKENLFLKIGSDDALCKAITQRLGHITRFIMEREVWYTSPGGG